MDGEGIATSLAVVIIVVIVVAGTGVYFLATQAGPPEGEGVGPGEENLPSGGPYYHQIYSATSSDGISWVVDNTLLFDHASVPGAVYFNNKVYVYYVNAADPYHEKLSVGISEDRGATFTVHDVQISGSNSPYPVDPNPIIQGNQIRLTYLGNFMQDEINKIVTAISSDGINFTEDGVIFTGDVYDPDLFHDEVGGQWVLFLNPGSGLTKATASSSTASFTENTDFIWPAGSISSTHKIGGKYYTYYTGMSGISVAEYSNGSLSNAANRILDFPGLTADPTVAVFGPNDYMMFFKTMVEQPPENQPQENQPPTEGEITIQSINSTYRIASGGTSGWFHTGQDADIMLSGIDFNNTGGPLLFNHPGNVASDDTRLLLADRNNNRVLIWNSLPTENIPPDIVLGQENFYANNPGTGLDQMNWPVGVATNGQHVAVADSYNDRILIWNTFPTTSRQPADLVIQSIPNDPALQSDPSYLKRRVGWPWGVWIGDGKLVVSCTADGSVLIWNSIPTQDNQPADIYLTGQGALGTPRTITSDGTHLIVGDHNPSPSVAETGAHGNFFWSSFPTSDDEPFDFFMSDPFDPIGAWMQGSFAPGDKLVLLGSKLHIWNSFPTGSTDLPDLSVGETGSGGSSYRFNGGDGSGAVYAGGKLYISLSNGNKIVGFDSLPTESSASPNFAVGAPDINTNTLETKYFITNPVPVSDGTSLFVSSDFDQKLYVWKNLPDESGAWPDIVYSLPFAPWDSVLFENTLILAGGETVCIWETLPREGELPDRWFRGSIGNVSLQAQGVALDNQYFYLADRNANKIHIWDGIPDNDTDPRFSIDIEMPTRLSSDGTYLVVAATEASFGERIKFYRIDQLSSSAQPTLLTGIGVNLPQAALAVDGHLFIGDTGFNRVLVWNNISDAVNGNAPEVALGEEDFDDIAPEIGVDKLFWPAAISFDGDYLWVGEFKFSGKILRFSPS